ncbi:hypothetical protein [Nostoc sp.]|uniref:hypothetical protein n=1 Tax=Nostoc sp. TaxID=1180 RepID=UPI002FF4AEC0
MSAQFRNYVENFAPTKRSYGRSLVGGHSKAWFFIAVAKAENYNHHGCGYILVGDGMLREQACQPGKTITQLT